MRLERDSLTWLMYAQLGCYGYFIYGLGPTLSLLRDEQGVSRSVAGLHGTARAVDVGHVPSSVRCLLRPRRSSVPRASRRCAQAARNGVNHQVGRPVIRGPSHAQSWPSRLLSASSRVPA